MDKYMPPLLDIEPRVEWLKGNEFVLQVDGNDLAQISGINPETGTAHMIVWATTHPDSTIAWQGPVNVLERGPADE